MKPGPIEAELKAIPLERDEEAIARAVLSYFFRHPGAADSLEGVARWRLLDEFVDHQVRETAAAVSGLVETGYLLVESHAGVESIYRLNPERIAEVGRLLQGSGADGTGRRAKP